MRGGCAHGERAMLPPVRCFTCNALVPIRAYRELLHSMDAREAFAHLKIRRYCCTRMLLCDPPELTATMSELSIRDVETDESELYIEMRCEREVGCA